MCADLLVGASSPVFDDTSDPYSFIINPDISGMMMALGNRTRAGALAAWDAAPWDADQDGLTDADDRAFILFAAQSLGRE